MKKEMKYSFVLLFSVALLLNACSSKKENAIEVEETVRIKVQSVHAQDVEQLYEYTAIVEANVTNNIAPTAPGRIDKIYVEVGDHVKAGQKLAQMDEANLIQAKTQLDNLETTFKRIDELYKVGGMSKSDWDAQKTALDVARTSYQNLLTNTQLISPINGIITARNYDGGDLYAGNSMQYPILQVQQIVPVKMKVNVSEMRYTNIKKGMDVDVKLDVYGDEMFKGKVNLVYPTIDRNTHTFPVEVVLQNSNERVKPGMYARVIIDMGSQNRVVVPDIAIIKQQGSGDRYVYVYNNDGTVTYTKVELGRRMGEFYEIISGINDGDQVAVTSLSRLNNGMKVELVK